MKEIVEYRVCVYFEPNHPRIVFRISQTECIEHLKTG